MQQFDQLKALVAEAELDVNKGFGGNKAAKVRARKRMQEIKAAAQVVREGLLDAATDTPEVPGADKPEA